MSALVVLLRVISLASIVGPLLLLRRNPRDTSASTTTSPPVVGRRAVVANFVAFALFIVSLVSGAGEMRPSLAIPLGFTGCVLALTGSALILRARSELGLAWSLAPRANPFTGLVTTGPYRLVRHPMYVGFALLTVGQALAFLSAFAILIVVFAIVPTLAWRAHVEERVLVHTFGAAFTAYRSQVKMLIPYLY